VPKLEMGKLQVLDKIDFKNLLAEKLRLKCPAVFNASLQLNSISGVGLPQGHYSQAFPHPVLQVGHSIARKEMPTSNCQSRVTDRLRRLRVIQLSLLKNKVLGARLSPDQRLCAHKSLTKKNSKQDKKIFIGLLNELNILNGLAGNRTPDHSHAKGVLYPVEG
jgi:hypothetical protein